MVNGLSEPSESVPVKVVPLGGLGEIGLNLMVIECGSHAIIIDAGVLFPEERDLGIGLILPELAYLEQSRLTLDGIILTHGHEDHIGALAYLLRRFPAPVFGTEVTLAFVRRGLAEDGLNGADLRELVPGREIGLGPFWIEPVRVTHSTPNAVALAIRTPAGLIVHSGDFKIDPEPVDGQFFDTARFAQLGEEGVTLLFSDSTNVERAGRTGSESSIKPVLRDLIKRTRGRFILSSFSSHLHRIRQFAETAHEAGRYVVPLGRRMAESVRLGAETGQLNLPPGTFIDRAEADFLQPKRLAYLAGGSQGEPLSAMAKLAADSHPQVQLDQNDVVVFSSRSIPGNERAINGMINHLYKRGAEVYYDAVARVHVSGHASRDELAELIHLVKPRYFVPVHGEYRHLQRHRALAIENDLPEANCFLLEDGQTLVMEDGIARRGHDATAGRVVADGDEVALDSLLRERRALARDGALVAIVTISARNGQVVASPELLSRGVVSNNGVSPHMVRARAELADRLRSFRNNGDGRANTERLKDEIVRVLRRYFSDETGKRPMIVPYVLEV
jgi:ribonuclease J